MAFNWHRKVNGYVEIQVEGYFSERFINLITNKGLIAWDIKKINDGTILVKVIPKDFKTIRKIAHVTGCKIKIVKKKGILFFMNRYKKLVMYMVNKLKL